MPLNCSFMCILYFTRWFDVQVLHTAQRAIKILLNLFRTDVFSGDPTCLACLAFNVYMCIIVFIIWMLYFSFHDHKSNLFYPFVSFQHVDKSVIRPIAFKPIITPQTRYVPAPAQSKLSPRQPGSHDLKSTNHNTDDGYVSQEYNSGTQFCLLPSPPVAIIVRDRAVRTVLFLSNGFSCQVTVKCFKLLTTILVKWLPFWEGDFFGMIRMKIVTKISTFDCVFLRTIDKFLKENN